jgi:UPF0716 protein FxsA
MPSVGSQLLGGACRAVFSGNVSTFQGKSSEPIESFAHRRPGSHMRRTGATMRLPFPVLILFTIFVEIAVFILVGEAIGITATLSLTLLAITAGAVFLRRQGTAALQRIRAELAANHVPARPFADAAMIALAGFLLILPGFVTDAVGIALFIPAVRSAIWRAAGSRLQITRLRREDFRPRRARVLELDPSEYDAPSRADTPWRPDRP